MNRRLVVTAGLAMFVLSLIAVHAQTTTAPAAGAASSGKAYVPARTPWGDPDLQGIYTNKDENGIPMERPGQFDGKAPDDLDDSEFAEIVRERNARAVASAAGIGGAETGAGPTHWYEHYGAKNSRAWTLIEPADGRIPAMTAKGQERAQARTNARRGRGPADSYTDRSLYDRCITRGIPGSMMPAIYGNAYEVVQAPGLVAIRYEMIHETRLIPLDRRPHVASAVRSYMGDPRGHWEGDTLVVETTNFNDGGAYRGGNPATLKLIERFKPVAPDKVEWTVRVEDADTWTKPWAFAMNLTKDETQAPFEYGCHEGNLGLANILSAARAEEKAAEQQKGR